MATIERFEDITAWKKARELTKAVYSETKKGQFARDFGLCDQIRRASVSIMANIAEGFERGGNKEFRHFLSISKASAAEVRSLLYVATDIGYIDKATFEKLYDLTDETGRMIGGFMSYLKKTNMKGCKYN